MSGTASCIFCKIARGEAPAHIVYEDSLELAPAPDGLMLFQLNGRAAGQTVFHYHMHLMPRTQGEEFRLHTRVPGTPERLAETALRLRSSLERLGRPG